MLAYGSDGSVSPLLPQPRRLAIAGFKLCRPSAQADFACLFATQVMEPTMEESAALRAGRLSFKEAPPRLRHSIRPSRPRLEPMARSSSTSTV